MQPTKATLHAAVNDVVVDAGLQLYYLEHKGKWLNVFLESDRGVTLDDCARVNRAMSAALDKLVGPEHEYAIEVSSPGVNRRLFTETHMQQAVGETVDVSLSSPVDGKNRMTGKLVASEQRGWICVHTEEHTVEIPLENVAQVILVSDSKEREVGARPATT